jgi:hypothetical protein
MVTSLWLIGRKDDAKVMFDRLLALRNDVGLLSEEYDAVGKRMVGNFPQALSHIALLQAAFVMVGLWTPEPVADKEATRKGDGSHKQPGGKREGKPSRRSR